LKNSLAEVVLGLDIAHRRGREGLAAAERDGGFARDEVDSAADADCDATRIGSICIRRRVRVSPCPRLAPMVGAKPAV
jgi:hypothetical protein